MALLLHEGILQLTALPRVEVAMIDQMWNLAFPQLVAEFHQFADQRKVNDSTTSDTRTLVDNQFEFLVIVPNFFDTQCGSMPS